MDSSTEVKKAIITFMQKNDGQTESLSDRIQEKKIDTLQTDKIACIVSIEEFRTLMYNSNFDKSNYVTICIHDPNKPTHNERHEQDNSWPQYVDGFKDVLEVKFWDVTEDRKYLNVIEDEVAKKVHDFILKNKDERFIIHCSAGISRSAGVGKAIECLTNFGSGQDAKYQYLTGYSSDVDSHLRYSPNLTVFDKIVETGLS